jgi:hypothetical protein
MICFLALLVWESPTVWPLAMAAGAVSMLAILWFYPGQLRGHGPWRWLVLVLRCVAVAALALSLLKPVFMRLKTERQRGAVVVLVDCSKSMGVTDPGRNPAERVALAAAIGRLPSEARSNAAALLEADLDGLAALNREVSNAQSDLEYARVAAHGIAEKQSRLAESISRCAQAARTLAAQSARFPASSVLRERVKDLESTPASDTRDAWAEDMKQRIEKAQAAARDFQARSDEQLYKSNTKVRTICDDVSKLPRLELARELLLHRHTGLVDRLGPNVPIIGLAVGQQLTPISLTLRGSPVDSLPISADASDSDLTGAVTAAVNGVTGGPVRAIVLISDGRQVGGRGDLTTAIHPSGIPIFTIGVAPDRAPDVSISSVSLASPSAFAGETVEGDVSVTDDGALKPPAELHVTGSAGQQVEPLTLRPRQIRDQRRREWTGHFSTVIEPKDGAAAQKIVLQVSPVTGETTTANNRIERWIKVSSDKLKVALCTAAPTWDFQYLRGALARRAWVQLESEVLDPEHPHLALTPRQILDQDVLILSEIPVEALDVTQWDAIHALLTSRGGSVVLIAGTSYPIADFERQPIARTLLPFHDVHPIWKEWPGLQPAFHFVPTPPGARELLRLEEGFDASAHRWQELPGVFRYLQIPRANLYADAQPLLLEADSGAAVLTERRLGAGRVLFLGLNETWRWRLKNGERDADQFWRQLVRHAAGEPYAASRGPLALDLDRVAVQPGETIHVRARVRGAKLPLESGRLCPIRIVQSGKPGSTRQLQATGGGHFSGSIADLAEGDYQIELAGTAADGSNVAVSMPLQVASSDEAEMRDVSGDSAMLMRISRSSGGQFLPIDRADRLAAQLVAVNETESRFTPRPLWNSPLFFCFVLACFAAEWALRKRFGLA